MFRIRTIPLRVSPSGISPRSTTTGSKVNDGFGVGSMNRECGTRGASTTYATATPKTLAASP
jgi:hypothetical protein